jgi:hypothetical protein
MKTEHKTEPKKETPQAPRRDKGLLIAVGIGILVFGGVFFFLRSALQPTEHIVNGILIQATSPQADIAAVLEPQNVVEQIGTASEKEFLPGRAAAATEIASALATNRKNVTVQGIIAGQYCVNANKDRIPCLHPQVLVNYSTCNCIRVEDGTVKVLGTDAWMFENGPKIRGIINWAIGKQ